MTAHPSNITIAFVAEWEKTSKESMLLTMLINEHDFALTCSTITIRYNIFHAPHFVCDIF